MIKAWILTVILTIILSVFLFGCGYRDPMPKWKGYQLEFKDG